ncbi:MAG: hypothetical protein C9356_06270 [Oleiphilus sp.]|nr:MAG: hypothetical protein C9356_06270 [Oleiphilus sp.]
MHLGIDLGGTKIEIIAIDKQSREHYRKRIPSPQQDYEKTLLALEQLVDETEACIGKSVSLGIGIPGAVSRESGLIKNANSTWIIGQDLQGDLSRRLQKQVYLANDADCFTLSEACDGAAQSYPMVFGVILGTGVGGGLCIDRKIICGPNAITGEWGHNPLPQSNLPNTSSKEPETVCYCGKTNCIETYLSGPAFIKHFHTAYPHLKTQIETAQALAEAAGHQLTETKDYFELYCDRLARGLTQVINTIDPDCIVLGGGLSNIDALYAQLPEKIARYIFSDSVRTKIVKAHHGDSSGVRGAAWLGMRRGILEAR